jgi:AraC-like DNA-binding protein
VVVINLSHNNYHALIQNIARQWKARPENNTITLPPEIGEGIIKVIQLPNGLQALMTRAHFLQDVLVKSGNKNPGDYVLNFDETESPGVDGEENITAINSFVRLTGSSLKHWEVVKKNSRVQYVKILFSKEWLSNYIGLREKMSQFEKFIPVKSDAAEKQKLNEEYRRIINELWEVNPEDPLQNIYYNNRILLLIEQFFSRMHSEMLAPKNKYKLTADDIVKLKKVEAVLNSPGKSPPRIASLAAKASMTQAKLSHAFRQLYGTSIYNYYQNQRMQAAHELLSTKNFSVKEVSEKLGYTNLSNFVLAFTKHFNASPKSLLE